MHLVAKFQGALSHFSIHCRKCIYMSTWYVITLQEVTPPPGKFTSFFKLTNLIYPLPLSQIYAHACASFQRNVFCPPYGNKYFNTHNLCANKLLNLKKN